MHAMTDLRAAILDALSEIEPASIGNIDGHLRETREDYREPPSADVRDARDELLDQGKIAETGDNFPPKYVRTDES